jgi:putative Mg2+ transporter-C (MgtC) family protein
MDSLMIFAHLFGAVLAGALIGLERTYAGRAAGFRTHVLVCTASSLLMLLSTQDAAVLSGVPIEALRVDPARMAQGIMTGIGFLGAGVIMKDGFSVRGLTTAASIWITASIGVVIGAGFYFAGTVATLLALMTLSLFRWIERIAPTMVYAHLTVRTAKEKRLDEQSLRALILREHIRPSQFSYRVQEGGKYVEYELTLHSRHAADFRRLAELLMTVPEVFEYSLTPTGEK